MKFPIGLDVTVKLGIRYLRFCRQKVSEDLLKSVELFVDDLRPLLRQVGRPLQLQKLLVQTRLGSIKENKL